MMDPSEIIHGASREKQVDVASHFATSCKIINKQHELSRVVDEFSEVDTRLAKIELKHIDSDEKLET